MTLPGTSSRKANKCSLSDNLACASTKDLCLAQCEQHGHEGVALLPSLTLCDVLCDPSLIFPQARSGLGQKRSGPEAVVVGHKSPKPENPKTLRETNLDDSRWARFNAERRNYLLTNNCKETNLESRVLLTI